MRHNEQAVKAGAEAVDVSVQDVELEPLDDYEPRGVNILNGSLEMIKGVKVRLEVRVGDAQLTVGDLLNLKQGTVVQLSQSITSPVEVLLDGRVLARGELSVVGDNFGIRITEIPE